MDFFKSALAQGSGLLGRWKQERGLWVAGALLLLLLVWLFTRSPGQPALTPLDGFSLENRPRVVALLRQHGIVATVREGQLMVPSEAWPQAVAELEQADLLSPDLSKAFDDVVARSSPWTGEFERSQEFLIAKQKVLGAVIAKMRGVKGAVVVIDAPAARRFSRSGPPASASVTVTLQPGATMDRELVDSIAGLVAGAVSQMEPKQVAVIDAVAGKRRMPGDADTGDPVAALQLVDQMERHYRSKIENALAYIPGLIVNVSVRTDPVLRKSIQENTQAPPALLKSSDATWNEQSQTRGSKSAPKTNAEMNLVEETATQQSKTGSKVEKQYAPPIVARRTESVEAGQRARRVSASLSVPRSYFVALYRAMNVGVKSEPDDATLAPWIERELRKIETQVEPLIHAEEKGVVRASVFADGLPGRGERGDARPVGRSTAADTGGSLTGGMLANTSPSPDAWDPPTLALAGATVAGLALVAGWSRLRKPREGEDSASVEA